MLCLQNKTKQSKAKQTNTTSLPTPQVFRHDKFTDTTISEILQVYRHDKLTDTVSLQSKTVSLQTRLVYQKIKMSSGRVVERWNGVAVEQWSNGAEEEEVCP